jgi:hypothetical protein
MHVADVVAAAGEFGSRRAVLEAGPHAYAHARSAGKRRDSADEQQRTKDAAAVAQARRKVGDPHPVSLPVEQVGNQDRRVGDVMLRRAGEVLDFDVECAARSVVALGAAEQRMEYRVAVRSRQTAPDDRAPLIDQRIERAP